MNAVPSPPAHIQQKHWQEWVIGSGIDPDLTVLSLRSLTGTTAYEYLLYSNKLPRRNNGRLSEGILKQYRHLEVGGWWCSGVNVLSSDSAEESLWGCFKPNYPRTVTYKEFKGFDREIAKAKLVKYEHPPKIDTELFALKVPRHIWEKISDRCGVPIDDYIYFWAWVKAHPEIPIILTEGAKKAGALLTSGYTAIALPGIYGGYRQPKDEFGNKLGKSHLIPQLELFAVQGRELTFCFDRDPKPQIVKHVREAIKRTGQLLTKKGCKVTVVSWFEPEKGVDDLITTRGTDHFHALYDSREKLERYNLKEFIDLCPFVSLTINDRFLSSSLVPPEGARLIGVKSPKGTGKTHWLSNIVERAVATGQRVIIIVHREQLAIALSHRFGVDYRTEIRTSDTKGALGYALCIDSLHPSANPPFNPDNWEGCLVIIDEVEQVLWHLLNSPTCKHNVICIIKTLKRLLQTVVDTGGRILVADADLSAISIRYLQQLIGRQTNIWIVENIYRQSRRRLYRFSGNNPSELLHEASQMVAAGHNIIIHTSGQQHASTWGTRTLELYFKQQFSELPILRIDRESVANPDHPACGCMGNLDSVLQAYRVVVCSPVVETGVSIECPHFSAVFGIFWGKQTVNAVCQSLERVRANVPRYIWANQWSSERIGGGAINPKQLALSQHKKTANQLKLLQRADLENALADAQWEFQIDNHNESIWTWSCYAAFHNYGYSYYSKVVRELLESSGFQIYEWESLDDVSIKRLQELTETVRAIKDENYERFCENISQAENLTDEEFQELKEKRSKSDPQVIRLKHGELHGVTGLK